MEKDDEPVTLVKTGLEPPPAEHSLEAFVAGAAYAALGVLAALVALVGSFLQVFEAGPVPVASIALVLVVFGLVRAAGWAMGRRLGALVPALVWTLVVFVLSLQRPEGDLIVPGTAAGYFYIVGGMVAAVVGVYLVPPDGPSGQWLLRGASRTDG
ncbi:DUF6113 family protein [Spirillospora sp. CA-294931]|uniref:DUF6113 family protein n=1 Tax=Spirillospora sp. CA-294931 TaxID=3240042 RepID=UPI003D89FE0A